MNYFFFVIKFSIRFHRLLLLILCLRLNWLIDSYGWHIITYTYMLIYFVFMGRVKRKVDAGSLYGVENLMRNFSSFHFISHYIFSKLLNEHNSAYRWRNTTSTSTSSLSSCRKSFRKCDTDSYVMWPHTTICLVHIRRIAYLFLSFLRFFCDSK